MFATTQLTQKINNVVQYSETKYFASCFHLLRLMICVGVTLLCFLACAIQAQTLGTVSGRLVTSDGNPLAAISVKLEATSYAATSDSRGQFSLNNIPPGKYILVISGGGFVPQKIEIEITVRQTTLPEIGSFQQKMVSQ